MAWLPVIQRGKTSMNRAAKIALNKTTYTQDDLGEWTETNEQVTVFAYISSVTMSEFYQAGLQGMKPEYRFLIWQTEYDGEETLEYNDVTYTIYRTYERDDGRLELYVTLKKGEEE